MTKIIKFESDHGPIYLEVSDATSRELQEQSGGLTKKGADPMSTETTETSGGRFDKAMTTLKAYAGSIQDIVNDLDVRPREVAVEVGLTLKGEAGIFAIARAGTEAEMKISLKWEPAPKAKATK